MKRLVKYDEYEDILERTCEEMFKLAEPLLNYIEDETAIYILENAIEEAALQIVNDSCRVIDE